MGCCDSMMKYIVFLFNFVFFLSGVALIGIGAWIQVHMSRYLDFLNSTYLNSSVVLIIVGAVILVVAFFGCCGACTENHCMLYTYGTLMALILLVEIGVAVTVYIYKDDVRTVIRAGLKDGMENYSKDPESEFKGVTETWNLLQSDFHCCGVDNYTDWASTKFGSTNKDVPDSCCFDYTETCGQGMAGQPEQQAKTKINVKGCFIEFEDYVMDNVAAVAGVGVGIAVLQVIGIIIACCLARNMREERNYV